MKAAKRVDILVAGVKLSCSQSQRPIGTHRGMSLVKLSRLTGLDGLVLGSRLEIPSTATTCLPSQVIRLDYHNSRGLNKKKSKKSTMTHAHGIRAFDDIPVTVMSDQGSSKTAQ